MEFFLFARGNDGQISTSPHDHGDYFDFSNDGADSVRKEMVRALIDLDINVEASHHEVAMGQHENGFRVRTSPSHR